MGLDKLSDDPPDTDNYPVRPAIGNFIWLAINLRFDIAPAVNVIACRQTKPSAKLVKFIKRVFRYLSATTDFALVYKSVPAARARLQCSSDSSFDVNTMGGYAWFLGDSLISWKVVTAKSAVTSTCEAELFFLCAAVKTGVWLTNFLKDQCSSMMSLFTMIIEQQLTLSMQGSFPRRLVTWRRSAILFISRSRMVRSRLSGRALKNSEQIC